MAFPEKVFYNLTRTVGCPNYPKERIHDMTDYSLLTEQLNAFLDTDTFYVPAMANASAVILDKTQLVGIKNITITFRLVIR